MFMNFLCVRARKGPTWNPHAEKRKVVSPRPCCTWCSEYCRRDGFWCTECFGRTCGPWRRGWKIFWCVCCWWMYRSPILNFLMYKSRDRVVGGRCFCVLKTLILAFPTRISDWWLVDGFFSQSWITCKVFLTSRRILLGIWYCINSKLILQWNFLNFLLKHFILVHLLD